MIIFWSIFLMGSLYGSWIYSVSRNYSIHHLNFHWNCVAGNALFGIIQTKIGVILFGFYVLISVQNLAAVILNAIHHDTDQGAFPGSIGSQQTINATLHFDIDMG